MRVYAFALPFQVLSSCLFSFSIAFPASAAWLMSIGDLPGGVAASVAFDVSDDGAVVVGRSSTAGGSEPIIWTRDGGLVGLGHALGSNGGDVAYGVSGDGSVVVGYGGQEAFRWTSGAGFQTIGGTFAHGASFDGSVVVGGGDTIFDQAFRWTAESGSQPIGKGWANGVSRDGKIVAGYHSAGESTAAWRWTEETGQVDIANAYVNAISPDGTSIVGHTTRMPNDYRAYYWREDTGLVLIGDQFSEAYDVNADGSIIVGRAGPRSSDTSAFIFQEEMGSRNLSQYLGCQGVDVKNWKLYEALGVSADGRTVVGSGVGPDGVGTGWVAYLDVVELSGDTNRDGLVDLTDLNNVRNAFGESASPILGDTNFDCGVDLADLNAVRNNFGSTSSVPVPEPSNCLLILTTMLCLYAENLRKRLPRRK